MPVYDASILHIRLTQAGATHWVSGPGNLSFDPECPRCWMDAWEADRKRLEALERAFDAIYVASRIEDDGYRIERVREIRDSVYPRDGQEDQADG